MTLADHHHRLIAQLMQRVHELEDVLGYANVPRDGILLEITQDDAHAIRSTREHFQYKEMRFRTKEPGDYDMINRMWSPLPGPIPPLVTGEWISLHGIRLVWLGK